MNRLSLLIVILALAACTGKPTTNTDSIAGYWSGNVDVIGDTGQENSPRVVGILIIKDCTTGKVCGKFALDGNCPGDIKLLEVDGNRFTFLSETASRSSDVCGGGYIRTIDLELQSDGTVDFLYHNGDSLSGILEMN